MVAARGRHQGLLIVGLIGVLLLAFMALVAAYALAVLQFNSNNGVNHGYYQGTNQSEKTVDTRRELRDVQRLDAPRDVRDPKPTREGWV